jgi:cytidine deaminase
VLFDYHPNIRVILPTAGGIRSVRIKDLTTLAAVWTVEVGTQEFDPTLGQRMFLGTGRSQASG